MPMARNRSTSDDGTINTIPVSDHVARSPVPRERLRDLAGNPFGRKVRHPWLGGPRRLTMYLATLDCATSNPSLRSSPWMRGAPQRGFSTLICRINARAAPPRSAAGLPKIVTSSANSSESQSGANA
jgi:hypothetical protein